MSDHPELSAFASKVLADLDSLQAAMERIVKQRDEALANADRLRRTLAVVLACFTARAHLGEAGDCLRTGWVQARTVDTWRKLVEVTRA